MKLSKNIDLGLACLSMAFTACSKSNDTDMAAAMAGTWSTGCYELPNKKFASRTVTVDADSSVVGDMTIFKDSDCTKEVKKVHKEYQMKLGKKTVGDDGKEAYEVNKIGKTGWKIYSMIRVISPTEIMPADKTKDKNGTTVELRANHFGAKTVTCKRQNP